MMLSNNIAKLLNEQINKEWYSAYAYLSISSYYKDLGLDGFAHFFRLQYKEELTHADKFFDFLHEVGGKANLQSVSAPPHEFKSIIHAFEFALEQEKLVTKSIHHIAKQAFSENDLSTYTFLLWFIKEQVEEESLFGTLLKRVQQLDGHPAAIYLLDKELEKREDQ